MNDTYQITCDLCDKKLKIWDIEIRKHSNTVYAYCLNTDINHSCWKKYNLKKDADIWIFNNFSEDILYPIIKELGYINNLPPLEAAHLYSIIIEYFTSELKNHILVYKQPKYKEIFENNCF